MRARRWPALLAVLAVLAPVASLVDAPAASAATATLTQRFGGLQAVSSNKGPVLPRWLSEQTSSVAVGDVLADPGLEAVVGSNDGWVHIFDASNGAELANVRITDRGLTSLVAAPPSNATGVPQAPVNSSPALHDLNNDGLLDIVATDMLGHVVGITGTGTVLFRQHACFQWDYPRRWLPCDVFASPAVADINGDGVVEIIVASMDHYLHVWSANAGTTPGARELTGFPQFLYDTSWSTPAVADVSGDGVLDIVVGGDMDINGGNGCCPVTAATGGGEVWAFSGATGARLWKADLPGEVIWSSPALGDVTGDGIVDVAVTTGIYFSSIGTPGAATAARRLYVLNGRTGAMQPGFPVLLDGPSWASPALGQLDDDAALEIAITDRAGFAYAYEGNGDQKWKVCVVAVGCSLNPLRNTLASPTIADVDNDGEQEVIVRGLNDQFKGDIRVLSRSNGAVEASAAHDSNNVGGRPFWWPSQAAPTVAQVDGEARIFVPALYNANDAARPDAIDGTDYVTLWAYGTGTPLGRADWPTFHQNTRRTGFPLDETAPSTAFSPAFATSSSVVEFQVDWWAQDTGSGVVRFDVDVRDVTANLAFVSWFTGPPKFRAGTQASGLAQFHGLPGRTYELRMRAVDGYGNASAYVTRQVTISAGATPNRPRAIYGVFANGDLNALDSPQVPSPIWPFRGARDIALRPDGSGYILDLFGGLHPIGGAPSITNGPYWSGWDIARGVALNPDGLGGYVLDGWGGLHAFGNAVPASSRGYWPGQDIARAVILLPTSTATSPAGYVMDLFGGLHRFGSAPSATGAPYWPNWAIARDIVANPSGPGGWTLDGFGGIHQWGGAPVVRGSGYWLNWDIARGIAMYNDNGTPRGYMLDGYGGTHVVNFAPPADYTRYAAPFDVGIDIAVAP